MVIFLSSREHLFRLLLCLEYEICDVTSFPPRRSSDLLQALSAGLMGVAPAAWCPGGRSRATGRRRDSHRSEEHTSELQSRRELVCRPLLEKKQYCTITSTSCPFASISNC